MKRNPGESFMYKNTKMVTFLYDKRHANPSRENPLHYCYICSFGSRGRTSFAGECGMSGGERGQCAGYSLFLTAIDFRKLTKQQRSLITINPNKFK